MRRIVATAVLAAGLFGVTSAPAEDRIATTLSTDEVIGRVGLVHDGYLLDVSAGGGVLAYLKADGVALADRLVRFTAGGTEICTDSTSSSGYAACTRDQVLLAAAAIAAADGYEASFAGDEVYAPASANAPIAEVTTGP